MRKKRAKRRTLTVPESTRRKAVRELEAGKAWRRVAKKYGVKTGTLTRWRRQYGDPDKPTRWTNTHTTEDKLRAVARVHKGESLYTVTRDIGCGYATLRAWLRGDRLGEVGEQYFSLAFKRRVVARLAAGEPITRLAARLRISDTTLRSWRRQYAKPLHDCPHCRHYK